jgi:membrane-associated PAP2 superfamily phosphatase
VSFSPLHRPLVAALLVLPLLVAWDASGLDMALSQVVAGSAGFPLRDNTWLVRVLHDGGRVAAALALIAQLVHAALPVHAGTPARRQRGLWLGMTLVGWVAVSWIKSKSLTSCPWDLAAFGGAAHYVGHWDAWWHRVADGAGGRCFPSGHALAGFAFFSLAFLWQPLQPRRAAWFALAALGAGLLFGAAQVLRGAHFVSHVLWSGWACWLLCGLVATAVDSAGNALSARRPAGA